MVGRVVGAAAGRQQTSIDGGGGAGQIAAVEVLIDEVVAVLEIRVADRGGQLPGRLQRVVLEVAGDDELVLDHPGVVELREAVGVLVQVVVLLVVELVRELDTVLHLVDHVEVQHERLVLEGVVRCHQNLVAVELGNAGILQLQVRSLVSVQASGQIGERGRRVLLTYANEHERCRQTGRRDVFVVRDRAVAVRVERQRRAGGVDAVVDERLRQAVPTGDLVTFEVVVHAAPLKAQLIADVHIEGCLNQRLLGRRVVVVGVGVFDLTVDVEAHVAAKDVAGTAHFGGEHALIPAASGVGDLTFVLCQVLAAFRASRLRFEVQVAADFRRAGDRRSRAAHDVDPVGCADRRGVVTRVVQPADAAEVGLSGGAAHVQRAGDAEE